MCCKLAKSIDRVLFRFMGCVVVASCFAKALAGQPSLFCPYRGFAQATEAQKEPAKAAGGGGCGC